MPRLQNTTPQPPIILSRWLSGTNSSLAADRLSDLQAVGEIIVVSTRFNYSKKKNMRAATTEVSTNSRRWHCYQVTGNFPVAPESRCHPAGISREYGQGPKRPVAPRGITNSIIRELLNQLEGIQSLSSSLRSTTPHNSLAAPTSSLSAVLIHRSPGFQRRFQVPKID
ncbi:hypothetical protein BJY04DRAFT_104392 [Aspergillus karnatakaensis]|uniref:uncharacterized protein n=1 Tax=Aspergillus karnatakaensis TaxID=1810916 RepID=UPI003CCE48AE